MMNMDWHDRGLRRPDGRGPALASRHRHGGRRRRDDISAPGHEPVRSRASTCRVRDRSIVVLISKPEPRGTASAATVEEDRHGDENGRHRRRKAKPKDAMAFSFADTIAGYVKRYDRNADAFTIETSDGREFTVELTDTTNRPAGAQPRRAVRRRDRRDARHARPGPLHLRLRGLLPGGRRRTSTRPRHLIFPGARAHDYVFEKPGLVGQADLADGRLLPARRSSPDGELDWRNYRDRHRHDRPQDAATAQETDTISRLVYGLSTAYLLTGEDRFLEAAETRHRVPARAPALRRRGEDVVYWYHGIEIDEPNEKKILASEFGDDYDAIPAYEQIYALAGPTQTYRITGDPRILRRHRQDDRAVRPVLPRPRAGRLLLAPRPDHARRRARVAGPQPGAQELELGRRPRPGLPDQPLAGDRRRQATPTCSSHVRDTIAAALPGRRQQPVRAGAVPRGLEPRPDLGLAAEPRGRRPQPQDRLEPDAHQPLRRRSDEYVELAEQDRRADAGGRQRPAARRLVRRGRARARAGRGSDTASPGTTARPGGSRSRRSWPT